MKLVSVETPEKSVCKMTFSASPEELEAASNAVYERTRASYTIRGFKKGEADRAQIEADRGEHTFWYDAINDLMDKDVPALYDAAMAEHGFVAVADPVYDLVSVKKDEGFVATATVALQPELNLTKTTGFVSECVTPEVSDKEIDNVLERHRAAAAELVPHKGPAVKGNIVHIDYEGLLEGKPFQGGTAQNQAVQLGSGRMIPGFEEGILGHKAGEEFEIFVTFPNRYHAKDLAGKPVVFKVKLIDVCVRQIPALNSDFAKKVANLDTMDQLRAQIRQQLHDGKHAAALNRAKDQILTQLADASEGELPSVLVETTYQQQMEQIQQQLQMQRLSLDRYLSQIHETRESFTAKVRSSAEKTSRVHMALLQIAQQENLLPTEEEIEKTLADRAERSKKTLDEVKANSNIPAMRRNEGIRKAADWVIEHSTIEDKAENQSALTIWNARRFALRIFSGKIIYNRAMPGGLRTARHCFFTGKVVEENSICWSGRTPSVKPCGFATSLNEGGSGETESFAPEPEAFPTRKAPSLRGLSPSGDWGSFFRSRG